MEDYKKEFINFMLECQVLKFGDFTLKSGRKSPFFMNAGAYVTGAQLKKLGEYYAKAIHDNFGDDFDVLFGPAYKGIPLATACVIAYSELYGKEIKYCSDRKEEKDHGADKGERKAYSSADFQKRRLRNRLHIRRFHSIHLSTDQFGQCNVRNNKRIIGHSGPYMGCAQQNVATDTKGRCFGT